MLSCMDCIDLEQKLNHVLGVTPAGSMPCHGKGELSSPRLEIVCVTPAAQKSGSLVTN
jgi:hypothetical protein